jgi:hypothetical protein
VAWLTVLPESDHGGAADQRGQQHDRDSREGQWFEHDVRIERQEETVAYFKQQIDRPDRDAQ